MIPKILHQMWLDKKVPNNDSYPEKYSDHVSTFNKYNSGFELYFWNMEKVDELFNSEPILLKYYKTWKTMPYHIQKCDFARFAIMYIYGGLYADLDFRYYRDLTPLLNRELLLVFEPPEHSESHGDDFDARLYNGFIGSVPKHQFWLDWMDYIVQSLKITNEVMDTTGPVNFRIWFSNSPYKNTPLVSTCDILPIYRSADGLLHITRECVGKAGSSKITTDYQTKLNNYADTRWNEGTGWSIEPFELIKNKIVNNSNAIILFLIALIIIVIVIISCKCYSQIN